MSLLYTHSPRVQLVVPLLSALTRADFLAGVGRAVDAVLETLHRSPVPPHLPPESGGGGGGGGGGLCCAPWITPYHCPTLSPKAGGARLRCARRIAR